jgi:hypothetical protein
MNGGDQTTSESKPLGFAAIGIFLFFGGVMAGLVATTLLLPGTPLDRAWILNPTAYKQLTPLGSKIGILFLLLAILLRPVGNRMVQTSSLGMETCRRYYRHARAWRHHQPGAGRLAARRHGLHNRQCAVALPFNATSQSCIF